MVMLDLEGQITSANQAFCEKRKNHHGWYALRRVLQAQCGAKTGAHMANRATPKWAALTRPSPDRLGQYYPASSSESQYRKSRQLSCR